MKLTVPVLIVFSAVLSVIIAAVFIKSLPPIFYIIIGTFCVFDLIIAYLLLNKSHKPALNISTQATGTGIPYSDKLISIDNEGITIQHYYFPFGAKKRIVFSDIEVIQAFDGGCLRIWGSSDFRTWFGLDWQRPARSMIFIIKLKNRWNRIGFTCENAQDVAQILRSKNLLQIRGNKDWML